MAQTCGGFGGLTKLNLGYAILLIQLIQDVLWYTADVW